MKTFMRGIWQMSAKNIQVAPWLVLLMAGTFVLGGFWGVQKSLLSPLAAYWQTRNWVETPAVLDEIDLRLADGSVYVVPNLPNLDTEQKAARLPAGMIRLHVRYHYEWAGEIYESERVGLHTELDEADAQRQAAARGYRKQQITVWVNPDNPAAAILDRSLHWGAMLVAIPSLTILLTGLVIVLGAAKALRQNIALGRR